MSRYLFYIKGLLWAVGFALAISGCNYRAATPVSTAASPSAGQTAAPAASPSTGTANPSPAQPSPTSPPLAARVNDYEITLADYQAELKLFQQGGAEPAADQKKLVLDNLIDEALLAQAAEKQGFVVDQTLLDKRIQQLGGSQVVDSWSAKYSYDRPTFERALKRSVAAAWMRDQISASVPRSAEQIHARQILHYNSDEAQNTLKLLQAGNDFGNLARKYDPVAGGDLGWFPRGGYLLDQKLEDAVFSLQPDQYSPIVETLAGYHILQVLERVSDRPLSPDALLTLQARAVQKWLVEHRQQGDIQVLVQ